MGRVSGKVAFVTGAARGQGRSHAIRLAQEGADIVAVDLCAPVDTVPYDLATPGDLAQTAKLVEEQDRRVLTREVDVRDQAGLDAAVADAIAEFGHIDILVANAGIATLGMSWELTEEQWDQMLAINLTGVWKTTKAVIPSMIEAARGGSIILTSSVAGLLPFAGISHYVSAKHGVTGLMRALSLELGPHNIRVNSVHPGIVNTDMIHNEASYRLFLPLLESPSPEEAGAALRFMNVLDVPWLEPLDISNMVLFLASEEARRITGTTQVVDAGCSFPYKIPHAT